MTSIYEKKISAEVRLIHAEQMSLYNFIILRKKQWTQVKTKQLKQDILNQEESIGFPKLYMLSKLTVINTSTLLHVIHTTVLNRDLIVKH